VTDKTTDQTMEKLHSLLADFDKRSASASAPSKTGQGASDRKRAACAACFQKVVRPVLERFMLELKNAGHDASTRDNTARNDAYPSVALSFTPRASGTETALASALLFKYDPRRGVLVQRDVKPSPSKGRVVTATSDRLGTIGVDAMSTQWVETKTLTFVEDVLKVN
jgi:hypothetical protein